MKKYYKDYEREFKSAYGTLTITRGEYSDLPIPMIPEEMSDEQMQKIVDEINLSMAQDYTTEQLGWLWAYKNLGAENGLTREQIDFADKMSEREFAYFENCAIKFGMRYWEDLSEEEYERLWKEICLS